MEWLVPAPLYRYLLDNAKPSKTMDRDGAIRVEKRKTDAKKKLFEKKFEAQENNAKGEASTTGTDGNRASSNPGSASGVSAASNGSATQDKGTDAFCLSFIKPRRTGPEDLERGGPPAANVATSPIYRYCD